MFEWVYCGSSGSIVVGWRPGMLRCRGQSGWVSVVALVRLFEGLDIIGVWSILSTSVLNHLY